MKRQTRYQPAVDGVLVENRIAERQGIEPGDEITIYDKVFDRHQVKVGKICRFYFGRNIYFSEKDYRTVFGEEMEPDTFLIRLGGRNREKFVKEIESRYSDITVDYPDQVPEQYQGLTDLFFLVVCVMIGLSILMSVVVLLNLVNIFVRKRKSELIVMAVNGFTFSIN